MIRIKNFYYLVFSLLFIFSACKEDDEELPGQAPTVNAGQDVTAAVGSAVQLSGTASDPDGDPLTTSWSVTSAPQGSSANISNASSLTASFTPDAVGNYTIRLTADDGIYDPVTDELIITAEEAIGEPPVVVIRNEDNDAIDETNNEVTINTSYGLDASQSSDPDSEELTFTWEITESPEDSEATLTPNEEGSMASFVPDAVGAYTIQLTVQDPEGNSTSQTVELIATANPVVIDENVSVATTWPNIFENPALPDYYVIADITVSEALTIAPGVKVMFEPNRGLTVSGNSGSLSAIGIADSLIVLTAEDTLNGWDGIFFLNENVQNSFDYADISYGGQRDFGLGVQAASIGVEASGGFSITNSTVSNSFNYGIYIENGGALQGFGNNMLIDNSDHPIAVPINQAGDLDENSTYSDNADNSVEILATLLGADDEVTIPALSNSTPFHVTGKLDIDGSLTIMPGARFELNPDAYIEVAGNNGHFTADGTASDSITFTARVPADGWGGFFFLTDNSRNSFAYARISYGGNRSFGLGVQPSSVGVEASGAIKITNSVVSNSVGAYGIFVESQAEIGAFGQNTFLNNNSFPIALPINMAGMLDAATSFSGNGDNSVEIFQSILSSNDVSQTLPAFADNTPYYVSGKLDIDNRLEINPGATLEFNLGVEMEMSGAGALTAIGTADSIITFTARDQADKWQGLFFLSNTASNKLEYVSVSYAGSSGFGLGVEAANIGIENSGKVAVSNSSISNSDGYGIFVESGAELTDGAGTNLTTNQEVIDAGNTFAGNASGETNL
ncbi:PKD domain-containing protein [Catalinimonas niigatensis]|uniref:PKD domain-containing protein n=1 Tax=Catalinimonas niigatensis TaxID=1397264 RepID=UPI002666EA31|nr:PKD domain-containing protein [Catalinimonas niigatensis]WPP49540.1 Ig-like domain-containing protein [Catalinimonas niigatensis]